MIERVQPINPIFGMRISASCDPCPACFNEANLVQALNSISESRHDYDMLMEAARFEEVDSFYNPGTDEVSEDFVLEAIVVDKFSKTERRMAAVVRVLNRHLANSEIKALDAIIGKPRKTGSFAYITVQLPFSDGQAVSVIFHAPEGDKKKIGPSDQIIAFRWLLNKRDITQVVAPEDGSEISLESIAKRLTQLVVKNSARFERTQKEAQKERQELDKAREDLKEAEKRQSELLGTMANASKEAESIEAKLANTLALLEKQKTINAELEARLDAMRKTQSAAGATSVVAGANASQSGNSKAVSQGMPSTSEECAEYGKEVIRELQKLGWQKSEYDKDEFHISYIDFKGLKGGTANPLGRRLMACSYSTSDNKINVAYGWEHLINESVPGIDKTSAQLAAEIHAKISAYAERTGAKSDENAPETPTTPDAYGSDRRQAPAVDLTELRSQLAAMERTLDEIKSGALSPQHYLGYRGSKKEAKRVIEADIKKWKQKMEEAEKEAFSEPPSGASKERDPFGEAYPEFTGKPEQAIEHLLKVKKGYVPGAFYKEGLGAIDLVWGNSSYGLEHIIKRRNEQGLDGVKFAMRIPQIIRTGKVENDSNANSKLIVSETDKAVIKLEWHTEKRTWLLTAYPLYESISGSAGTLSAEQTSGNGQPSSTTPEIEITPGSGRTPDLNQTYDDRSTPPSNPDNENLTSSPAFVNDLKDIIADKYGLDSGTIIKLFEAALDEAEKLPNYKDYEELLTRASDHLTAVLNKKAGK